MKGHARKNSIPSTGSFRGGTPAVARSAAMRWVLRHSAMCLASSLLMVCAAASTHQKDDYLETMYWEYHQGCNSVKKATDYLKRVETGEFSGKYSEQANECLKRWENEDRDAWNQVKGCNDIDAVKNVLREYKKREHRESPYAREASECIAKLEKRTRIERRLDGCRRHFDAGRISTGLPGNALECYAAVEKDDPGNPDALKGIDDIVAHYTSKAEEALDRGDSNAAERAIEQVAMITPESLNLEVLRKKLEDLRHQIAAHERVAQEREELHAEVERLFGEDKFEEVIALVAEAGKRKVEDKRASTLAQQAQEALATAASARELEAKVTEVRARIQQKDATGARTSLQEAQVLGLDPETHGKLTVEIERVEREKVEAARRQEREAIVSESQALRESGDYEGARDAMRRALDMDLPEERYREEMERIDRMEAAQLLARCGEHKSRRRWQEALACVRRVLELDDDNADAREEEQQLDMLAAFSRVHQSPTVEGWFEFIQDYSWSPFVDAANEGLRELESSYWEEVKAADTRERYLRYLEIYPAGTYSSEARRLTGGG